MPEITPLETQEDKRPATIPGALPVVASIGPDGKVIYPEDTEATRDLIFPEAHRAGLRIRAFEAFMLGTEVADIEGNLGLAHNTLLRWIIDGGWNRKRKELMVANRDAKAMELEAYRQEERRKFIESSVDLATSLQDAVKVQLTFKGNTAANLKSLGDTLAAATKVGGQALGISEAGLTSEATEERVAGEKAAQAAGSKPLVLIFSGTPGGMSGGLPPIRAIEDAVIEVTAP